MQLCEPVRRQPRPWPLRVHEGFVGAPGFVEGLRPLPVQPKDLGSVGETLAAVGHEARLRATPVAERGRPFLCAPNVEQVDAGGNHAAIHHAGDDRRDVAGSDSNHHLVEEREAFSGTAGPDKDTATSLARKAGEIGIGKTLADGLRREEGRLGAGQVAGTHLLKCVRQQHVSALDAVIVTLIEQTAAAGHPAGGPRRFSRINQAERDPEGRTRGLSSIALLDGEAVRARVDVDADGRLAREKGGNAQTLEVGQLEPAAPIERQEPGVFRLPVPAFRIAPAGV